MNTDGIFLCTIDGALFHKPVFMLVWTAPDGIECARL